MIYRPIQYVCAFVWKGAEKVIGREEKESGSRSSTRLANRLRISGRPCLAVLIALAISSINFVVVSFRPLLPSSSPYNTCRLLFLFQSEPFPHDSLNLPIRRSTSPAFCCPTIGS